MDFRLRSRIRSTVILALLCAGLASVSQAQEHALAPEQRAQVEAAVSKFMASTHVPGISIAIVQNGEIEWASGFGLADLENALEIIKILVSAPRN